MLDYMTAQERVKLVHGFLNARRIALVGASAGQADHYSFNARITRAVIRSTFDDVVLVGRGGSPIDGHEVVGHIAESNQPAGDLCVVALPSNIVMPAILDAVDVGWSRFLVISDGFGVGGKQRLDELSEAGNRIWGPNCIGFTVDETKTFVMASDTNETRSSRPNRRRLAVIGQSGGALENLADLAYDAGAAVSHVVSTGEELHVGIEAMLSYFAASGTTDGVLLFVEQARRPREYLEALEECAAAGLPVVVVKVGQSQQAQAAAFSHSGALVGDSDEFAAATRARGGIITSSLRDAANVANLLINRPELRSARRLALFSSSGGQGALACDVVERTGLQLSPLTTATKTVASLNRSADSTVNPFDSSNGGGTPATLPTYLDVVDQDPSVDAIIFVHGAAVYQELIAEKLTSRVWTTPLLVSWPGLSDDLRDRVRDHQIPVLDDVGDALRWLDLTDTDSGGLDASPSVHVDDETEAPLASQNWLTYGQSVNLLLRHGVAMPARYSINSGDDPAAVADSVRSFPVVLKATGLKGHKARHGGVRAGLAGPGELVSAIRTMSQKFPELVVEQHAPPGVDVFVTVMAGAFGGLLIIGLGGGLADLLGRQVVLPIDTPTKQVETAVARSMVGVLLRDAFGESVPAARWVAELTKNLQQALEVEHLASIEINPVIVSTDGALGCDVKIELSPGDTAPTPVDNANWTENR